MIGRGFRYAEPVGWVRARLGRLLNAQDYASMLRAADLDETVACLRDTSYGPVLGSDGAGGVSFGDALRQHHLNAAERLMGLLPHPARELCRAFLLRHTIASLKVILRTVGDRAHLPSLGPLAPDAELPLERLIAATSLEGVVEALFDTPYAEPLRAALRPLPGQEARVADLGFLTELQLDRWFFERLWGSCEGLPRAEAVIVRRLVGTFADVTNVFWARRLRDTFRFSPEETAVRLIPCGFHLKDPSRRALASWEVDRPLPHPFDALGTNPIGLRARLLRMLCHEASRPLCAIPFQAGLPLAYLMLAELEVCDLVTLYEGKRWGVSAPTLADRLIRFEGRALS